MILPSTHFAPPKLELTETARLGLIALYLEMINVHNARLDIDDNTLSRVRFDQDDCDHCVIGNGIRSGIFSGIELDSKDVSNIDQFTKAIGRLDIPGNVDDERSHIVDYLFMSEDTVRSAATLLLLPICTEGHWDAVYRAVNRPYLDELDACVRIAAVLDRCGYNIDVRNLPDVPTT